LWLNRNANQFVRLGSVEATVDPVDKAVRKKDESNDTENEGRPS